MKCERCGALKADHMDYGARGLRCPTVETQLFKAAPLVKGARVTWWGLYRKGSGPWRLTGVFHTQEVAEMAGLAMANLQMRKIGYVDSYESREITLTQARDEWRRLDEADKEAV